MLTSNSVALFTVVSDAVKELKRLFFVPKRLERTLYEIGAKYENVNDFWDKVQTMIWTSDPLSSFLLRHLIGIATSEFGPLGTAFSDDIMHKTTRICVCDTGQYPFCGHPLEIEITDVKLQNCFSFMKTNPVFIRNKIEETEFLDLESMLLLENLDIVSFNSERQMYSLRLPSIYPWDLNCCVIKFLVNDDYCRRIYRDFDLRLENPLSANNMLALISNLLKIEKENLTFYNIIGVLKDFCHNVISITYEPAENAKFEMAISFPLSLERPETFGSILWALKGIPKVAELMPFDWFRAVLMKAIETSRLLGVTIGISDLLENSTMFFTSPSVADAISAIANSFRMIPMVKHHESAKMVRFSSRRDLKRIGIISRIGTSENEHEMSVEGLIFEILSEVLRIRPRISILLKELATRLEVNPDFLESFIKSYLNDSLDLGLSGEIAPLEDPWLKLGV
jgi:hypothetical protein